MSVSKSCELCSVRGIYAELGRGYGPPLFSAVDFIGLSTYNINGNERQADQHRMYVGEENR